MHAIVIEHVRVGDLPKAWRNQLPTSEDTTVTIRIEEETPVSLNGDPLFGMWRDREDMANIDGYVRQIRTSRFTSP